MIDWNSILLQAGVLAQIDGAQLADYWPFIALLVLVLIVLILVVGLRKKPVEVEKPERPRAEEGARPTRDLLEDRPEVDAPVEITEGMSLAEIKRAKRSRVVDKQKRETAAETTEKAKKDRDEINSLELADTVEAESPFARSKAEESKAEEPAVEEPAAEEPEKIVEPEVKEPIKLKKPLPRPSVAKPKEDEKEDEEKKGGLKLPVPPVSEASEVEVEEEPVAEEPVAEEPVAEEPVAEEPVAEEPLEKAAVDEAKTLRQGLQKTRTGFVDRLGNLFKRETLDEDLVDEIEEILFTADIGTKIAGHILKAVEEQVASADQTDPGAVWTFIREYCEEILSKHQAPVDYEAGHPFVMLVIGVNGVGKTTTIGKLASKLTREGKKVLLVAGDTFRAAAVDQLGIWAERTDIPLHSGEDGADPSSVIFGGIERGVKEDFDVVICDTAGRLHTKSNLLDELNKMGRVAGKALEGAPHETILVLDANTGQNAIAQANLFKEALDITGIVLTKLDGTAKGGVILGICDEIAAPVRYIGIGEGVDDLRPFDSREFVEALFM
ncbi:MAG: signal recognition particle-docking protein FtsY [Bradymonadaceae bacterium]